MRILVINNAATVKNKRRNYFVHKSTGEFGQHLVEKGYDVEFFQFLTSNSSTNNYFNLEASGIFVSGINRLPSKTISYFRAFLLGIKRVIANDYIYVFYPNTFSFLLLVAIVLKKKYGLYIRGEVGIRSIFSKFLYRNADSIFTVSNLFTEEINQQIDDSKAITIKPMISFSEKDMVYNRDYVQKECYRILFLGRIDKDKGIFELLDAANILKQSSTFDFIVEIVGDGAISNIVKDKVKELGIQDNIRFYGPIYDADKIRERYINADIFVLPTYHEGFPRTLYEAMIFGTPIITTFVGTIPGLMKDGYNCFRIEPKSVDSLVKKLIVVMDNYSVVTDVVENAKKTVLPLILSENPSHPEMLHDSIQTKVQ